MIFEQKSVPFQYGSVKARDAINRRQDKGLIIVKTAIYRVFAIALAAVAILADDSRIRIAAISVSIVAVIISAMAHTLKTDFERSYTRH